MCHAVRCRNCGKTTWSGCGLHVQDVMSGVPTAERCGGHSRDETGSGWLSRLLGR